MQNIAPERLRALLLADDELALIDVREQGAYSEGHLLHAACIPLSRLELLVGELVPRRTVPLVVVSGSPEDGLTERTGRRLRELGYTDIRLLAGGCRGWQAAGFELFTGVNVPSKAFGEFIEHAYGTPRLTAGEVKAMLDEGRDLVIVDARPFEEYHRMNIPTATDMPGAELVYRIHDLAPDPDTLVVVNCAGRTRSIIGAQSLINAGLPNPVAALKDGTMGWHLAGFELERQAARKAPAPGTAALQKAKAAADRVTRRFGIRSVESDMLADWLEEPDRTTFLLDVRSPDEYAAGHLPGFRNAPGGQLVQATDEYVGVKHARLVLADDCGVRATMTASWLIQMGWKNVFVLDTESVSSADLPRPRTDLSLDIPAATLDTRALAALQSSPDSRTIVIDLGPSTGYERTHVPGAWWCVRARLADALAEAPEDSRIVLTSPDGLLARIALTEARSMTPLDVEALAGGTGQWLAEDRPSASGLERTIGPTDDVWFKPYDHRGNQEKFMRDYLTWEVALIEQIERDGTTRFLEF